ncbi:MAG: efflux RND transporter periplasmic adaptor subunit [Armatimonadetes bacterium]|nr:efflux RND transporter periplasmic adaptor subunit [Armatimonadota bacterium]NIM75176.1 efflux RND transporter periplasmic adaptor subunit [Armatimonadota bacterium]
MKISRASIALAIFGLLTAQGCSQRNTEVADEPEGLPVEVTVAEVTEMTKEVIVTGTVRTIQDASVVATFSDRVVEVTVREGDSVKKGQVLIRLDDTRARSVFQQNQAALTAAEKRLAILKAGARTEERAVAKNAVTAAKSSLDKAALDLERLEGLYEEGAAPKEQVDSARTYYDVTKSQYESALEQYNLMEAGARTEEIEAAAAAVEQAKAARDYAENDLENTILRSPISGVVYFRNINVGDVPGMGGDPLMRIAALEQVYLEASVPEKNFAVLAVDQQVSISADALPGKTFEGRVERLVPVAEHQSREFMARIAVENTGLQLRPGMFARGSVLLEKHAEAVVVPKEAMVEQNGKKTVFVVQSNRAEPREVTIGLENAAQIEILSGIAAGDKVITSGQEGLKSGQLVTVTRRQSGE